MIYSVEDSSLSDALNKSHGQIDRAFKHKTKASACAEAASRLVGRFEGRGRHLTSAATKRIGLVVVVGCQKEKYSLSAKRLRATNSRKNKEQEDREWTKWHYGYVYTSTVQTHTYMCKYIYAYMYVQRMFLRWEAEEGENDHSPHWPTEEVRH